jgi:hypothetical protein
MLLKPSQISKVFIDSKSDESQTAEEQWDYEEMEIE